MSGQQNSKWGYILILLLLFQVAVGCGSDQVSQKAVGEGQASLRGAVYNEAKAKRTADVPEAGSTLEVQKARAKIETEQIEADYKAINKLTENMGGYAATENKNENDYRIRRQATLRVPSSRFDTFIEQLQATVELTSLNLKNYRISIQASKDEINVLNETMADMERLRERINRREVSEDLLDLLMKLNEKKMELVSNLKHYQRELAKSRKQSRYATVRLKMTQPKPVHVFAWPEDEYRQWVKRYRDMTETFWKILVTTPANLGLLILYAIQLAIYLSVALLFLWIFARILLVLVNFVPDRFKLWTWSKGD